MTKKHDRILADAAPGTSHQEDLKSSYRCGSGEIVGDDIRTLKGAPIAVFTFTFPLNDDLLRAMQQLASQTVGCQRHGVRPNTKQPKQAVLLLNHSLSFQQKIAAARSFRDKVITWCNEHPEISHVTAHKPASGRPDQRDANRRSSVPSVNFQG